MIAVIHLRNLHRLTPPICFGKQIVLKKKKRSCFNFHFLSVEWGNVFVRFKRYRMKNVLLQMCCRSEEISGRIYSRQAITNRQFSNKAQVQCSLVILQLCGKPTFCVYQMFLKQSVSVSTGPQWLSNIL